LRSIGRLGVSRLRAGRGTLMTHRNARLTQFGRLLLVQRIIELGWPPAQAAEALGASRATACTTGWAATAPRPSRAGRPQLPTSPTSPLPARPTRFQVRGCWPPPPTPPPGPAPAGLAAAHVSLHDLWGLRRHHMSRLAHTDRASGVPDSAGVGRRATGGPVEADRQLAAPSGQGSASGRAWSALGQRSST
jgi:hypothetical protein